MSLIFFIFYYYIMSDVYHKPQEPIMWGGSSLWHKPHTAEFIDSPYFKEHLDMGLLFDPKKPAKPDTLEKAKREVAETRPPTNTRKMYSGGGGGMGGRGNVRYA